MAIGNYGELKAAVRARAIRTDLDALIPDFIRAAHDVLVGRLSLGAEIAFDADRVALPSDLRRVESVWADGYPASPMTQVSEAQMAGIGVGTPRYFRIDGGDLVLAPAPSASVPGRVLYKLSRTFFDDDADSNTALIRYPFVYLHGAMAELFAHVRNGEERDRYLSLFVSGLEAANGTELEDLNASGTLRPIVGTVI